jgi:hypothetical protein
MGVIVPVGSEPRAANSWALCSAITVTAARFLRSSSVFVWRTFASLCFNSDIVFSTSTRRGSRAFVSVMTRRVPFGHDGGSPVHRGSADAGLDVQVGFGEAAVGSGRLTAEETLHRFAQLLLC